MSSSPRILRILITFGIMIGRQPALLLSFYKVKSLNVVQEVCCNQFFLMLVPGSA
jgi:hypothetical protein